MSSEPERVTIFGVVFKRSKLNCGCFCHALFTLFCRDCKGKSCFVRENIIS